MVFSYIENIANLLETEDQFDSYSDFLLSFLDFEIDELLITAFVRKTLAITTRHIASHKIPPSVLKKKLPSLYSKLLKLINLRYNRQIANNNPLWIIAGACLIDISGFLIDPSYKPRISITLPNAAGRSSDPGSFKRNLNKSATVEAANNRDTIKQKMQEFKEEGSNVLICAALADFTQDEELQQIAWDITLKSFKEALTMSENSLLLFEKELAEEIIRKSQEFSIGVISFTRNTLIPNSKHLSNDKLKEIIEIIDAGTTSFTRLSRQGFGNFCSDMLSKRCVETLIEVCKEGGEERLAQVGASVLANRCKEVMKEYLADEKRNGLIPLSRYFFYERDRRRVSVVVDLLEKLRSVRIRHLEPKGRMTEKVFEEGKGHLVYMMPILIKCIDTREVEIRDSIKDIFVDISKLIAIKQ
eukprot:TRINITY_DN3830_c0_g1_i17.p1 TRINITY_DN3830_c0_g1~~TRINITY_DN3830_c0_g1_i17.p1  ORF type:complete len:415 (-),score=79.36 TRINITY_DN3830_c0_g1_i17:39-1283(-)